MIMKLSGADPKNRSNEYRVGGSDNYPSVFPLTRRCLYILEPRSCVVVITLLPPLLRSFRKSVQQEYSSCPSSFLYSQCCCCCCCCCCCQSHRTEVNTRVCRQRSKLVACTGRLHLGFWRPRNVCQEQ